MDETPGGSPGEPPQPHDEEQLPQEPPHEELPFDEEEHHARDPHEAEERRGPEEEGAGRHPFEEEREEHGSFEQEREEHGSFEQDGEEHHGLEEEDGDHHGLGGDDGEHHGPEDDDGEHHTVEETELAGDLGEDTALHLIDDAVEFDYHALDETDYGSLEEHIHSPEELRQRRLEERAAHRRVGRQRLLALILSIVAVVVIVILVTSGGGGKKTPLKTVAVSAIGATGSGQGYLAAGSSATALPGNILVADRNNNRILAITPQGQVVWSHNLSGPSDAYPNSTARLIVVTEHGSFQVLVLSVARGRSDYHYGHAGHPGTGLNRLHDPSTGQLLPDGKLLIADKANCRILLVTRPSHHVVTQYGTTGQCVHKPPGNFGYPDGAFPTPGGGLVVTEETPPWIDLLSKTGALVKAFQVKGLLTAPYAANPTPGGDYIATDYARPGGVVEFDSSGTVKWSYAPKSGPGELSFPTLAIVLSNGNVLVSDARNNRVVVIDPSTNQIVWQFGHTGKAGAANGFLHTPDSAVPVPSG
ncbi:MAG TPA: hypothetical protein VN772_01180 [Solirubrobacteraceae bacterium]|nr:hypothetical protein [Solirubrobacteraceae bacterium]